MTDKVRRNPLGRGLAALLKDDRGTTAAASDAAARAPRLVPIGNLHPGRLQPRRRFDPAALEALAASIRNQGVLQPLVVRPLADRPQHFEIVAGERRWRAAQRAELHELPVVVKPLRDRDALEIALIENIQREDLTALEEAEGYRQLIEQFGHTQEALATAVAMGVLAFAASANAQDKGTVGIAMPTKSSARWIADGDNIAKTLQARGYKTDLQYADNDIPTQLSQVENMITKKEKVLVIAAIGSIACAMRCAARACRPT